MLNNHRELVAIVLNNSTELVGIVLNSIGLAGIVLNSTGLAGTVSNIIEQVDRVQINTGLVGTVSKPIGLAVKLQSTNNSELLVTALNNTTNLVGL